MKTSNIILSTILVLFMCSCQEKIEKNTIDILKHSSIDTLVLGATKPYSKEHTHLLQKFSIEKYDTDAKLKELIKIYNNSTNDIELRRKTLCLILIASRINLKKYYGTVSYVLHNEINRNDAFAIEILEDYYNFIFPPLTELPLQLARDLETLAYKNPNNSNPIFNLVFYQYPIDRVKSVLGQINPVIFPELLKSIDKMKKRNGNEHYYDKIKKEITKLMIE